jgi:hypothetical protein
LSASTQAVDRNDFDASCFPALRRPLGDDTEPLFVAIATTWHQERIARWQQGLVPRDCPLCSTSHRQSDLVVAKNGVDVVRCRECSSLLDVAEHLPDPVASLRRLASHLETDGLLLIQVPTSTRHSSAFRERRVESTRSAIARISPTPRSPRWRRQPD